MKPLLGCRSPAKGLTFSGLRGNPYKSKTYLVNFPRKKKFES